MGPSLEFVLRILTKERCYGRSPYPGLRVENGRDRECVRREVLPAWSWRLSRWTVESAQGEKEASKVEHRRIHGTKRTHWEHTGSSVVRVEGVGEEEESR